MMIWIKAFGIVIGIFLLIAGYGLSIVYGSMWVDVGWILAFTGVATFFVKKAIE